MSAHDPFSRRRGGVLDEVRRNCARVAEAASSVTLLREEIPRYADVLLKEEGREMEMEPALHYLGHGDGTVAFFFILDAVNFGSGYFPDILPDQTLSGYRSIAAALTKRFVDEGIIPPEVLAEMSVEDAASLFALDPSLPPARELASLFAWSLRDLGDFVLGEFGGSFLNLLRAAEHSAERLVTLLASMPLYRDVATYGGEPVPFYKRAQITAADLSIAFRGEGLGEFADIDALTVFADNLVPHVLRHDGLLRYSDELGGLIDRGEALTSGSPEETEIRACAVHAAELLVAELRRRGLPLNALWVDNRLWHRGQRPRYRRSPRHRTRTPWY